MLSNIFVSFLKKNPNLFYLAMLLKPRLGAVNGSLQSVHDMFRMDSNADRLSVDLGCGTQVSNRFLAGRSCGLDLNENSDENIGRCRLGFDALPFSDDSVDYLTAYDLIEHIPRYSDYPYQGHTPFIFLMNECYRVLNKGGLFLSTTPIYPYFGAFQDPTHNNVITADTFRLYFSTEKLKIASQYGVTANFRICYQGMLGQHLVAVLKK